MRLLFPSWFWLYNAPQRRASMFISSIKSAPSTHPIFTSVKTFRALRLPKLRKSWTKLSPSRTNTILIESRTRDAILMSPGIAVELKLPRDRRPTNLPHQRLTQQCWPRPNSSLKPTLLHNRKTERCIGNILNLSMLRNSMPRPILPREHLEMRSMEMRQEILIGFRTSLKLAMPQWEMMTLIWWAFQTAI